MFVAALALEFREPRIERSLRGVVLRLSKEEADRKTSPKGNAGFKNRNLSRRRNVCARN
jgi:hypothetical protein